MTNRMLTVLVCVTLLGTACGGGGGDGGATAGVDGQSPSAIAYVVAGGPGNQSLFRFPVDAPDQVDAVGPLALPATYHIEAIVYRPQDGQLYALAANYTFAPPPWPLALYRIDPETADATFVHASTSYDFGFGPLGFAVDPSGTGRVVNSAFQWTIDLDVGQLQSLPSPEYIMGDPNESASPGTVHLAYASSGQPLVVDVNTRSLGQLATLTNPDPGRVSTVGSLGAPLSTSMLDNGAAFGIDGGRGLCVVRTTTDGLDRLYEIDLTTGAATEVGLVGDGLLEVDTMAIAP